MVRKATRSVSVTSGKEWRQPREQGVLVKLPSGNFARIRSVGLDMLLKLGKIPDALTPLVARKMGLPGDEPIPLTDPKGLALVLELAEAVCCSAFISPRIVEDPTDDDEIAIDDLALEDKLFVLGVIERPARELESFRFEPPIDVEPVPSESVDDDATERVAPDLPMDVGEVPTGRVVDELPV